MRCYRHIKEVYKERSKDADYYKAKFITINRWSMILLSLKWQTALCGTLSSNCSCFSFIYRTDAVDRNVHIFSELSMDIFHSRSW